MESLHLPRLDLGIFKNSSRYLERVGKPTTPFQPPVWAAPHKPHAIALVDVFKANEVLTSVNVDSKACFLFGRNALVCDIVLEHCSISRFGVSSRTYRFKSYESRQQIERRVQTAVGLLPDERELHTNTLLNRFLSYRLDAPFHHQLSSMPTNPWPQNSNRIASHSTDTNEDAHEEEDSDMLTASMADAGRGGASSSLAGNPHDDDMVVSECNPSVLNESSQLSTAAPPSSRKRTRPSAAVPPDHVFLTYDNKRVHFVESPQIIHHYPHHDDDDDDDDVMDVIMDSTVEDVQPRRASFDGSPSPSGSSSSTTPHFIFHHMAGSETSRCRPSIDPSSRIPGARRHTLG
ncbi:hypothetical protein DYB30_005299 [Aphanomyces astaci]|uniref:Uncharacterized protein n=1 Tax=Aphanomyces astaci TaxID=112090 RepID=A0A397CFJ8_APHAT|nr:hypothetical protein DYB30_005299 [Aphanomyces astaci]